MGWRRTDHKRGRGGGWNSAETRTNALEDDEALLAGASFLVELACLVAGNHLVEGAVHWALSRMRRALVFYLVMLGRRESPCRGLRALGAPGTEQSRVESSRADSTLPTVVE